MNWYLKQIIAISVLAVALMLSGCTSATTEPTSYNIEIYSGGEKVREWTSMSHPSIGSNSCWFTDKTGQKVRVVGSATVITSSLRSGRERDLRN